MGGDSEVNADRRLILWRAAAKLPIFPSMLLPRRYLNDPPNGPRAESAAARSRRLAHEQALIEVARAELDAGQGISGETLDAWLDRLDGDEELMVPGSRPVR